MEYRSRSEPQEWPLRRGERLLWSGGARKRFLYTRLDVAVDLGGLFFLFVVCPFVVNERGLWTNPFFLTFLVGSILLIAFRAFASALLRGSMRYAVTDRRVIVHGGFEGPAEVALDKIESVSILDHRGGARSVLVGDVPVGARRRSRHVTLWSPPEWAYLERLDDPDGAYAALWAALRGRGGGFPTKGGG